MAYSLTDEKSCDKVEYWWKHIMVCKNNTPYVSPKIEQE